MRHCSLRAALLATSSALAMVVMLEQPAQAYSVGCSFNNQSPPVDNTGAANCISYNNGSSFSGDVTNDGTLTPTHAYPPVISGTASGISVVGSGTTLTGDIVNNGTISSSAWTAINIGGGSDGAPPVPVPGASVIGAITNNGTINGGIGIGVVGSSVSGPITNGPNGIISTSNNAFYVANGATVGSLVNNGTIEVVNYDGIYVDAASITGSVTNNNSISVGGSADILIANQSTIGGSVVNNGTLDYASSYGAAIQISTSSVTGSFTNGLNGVIDDPNGMYIFGTAPGSHVGPASIGGDFSNAGQITATTGTGIAIYSASVTGAFSNSGTITAPFYGMLVVNYTAGGGGASSVGGGINNSGSISSTGTGAAGIAVDGATISNGITNTSIGTITATNGVGILLSDSIYGPSDGLATITGGLTNAGTIIAKTGIVVGGGSTVAGGITNSGTITGNGGTAIDLTDEGAAATINQQGGTISGDILLSSLGDTVNITGGSIAGNITGQGSSSTVDFALGTGTFTYENSFTTINQVNFNSGTVVLEGADTATNVAVNGGTVAVGNNSAFGTAAVSMAAGTTLSFLNTANFTIANNIAISGDPIFAPPSGTTQTISGVISDGGSPGTVEVNGAGTLVLSSANTYTGGTTLDAGILNVSADGNLGGSSGALTFNGGTLQFDASFNLSSSRVLTLNSGGGTIDTNSFSTTVSQAIGGTGGLTVANTGSGGSLTLANDNGYSGATTINSGATLILASGGSIADSAVADAGTLQLGASSNIVSLSGAGLIELGGNTLTLSNASGNYSGVMSSGGGSLTISAGTETLSGANTYGGPTSISSGATLVLASGGSIASSQVLDSGTLNLTASSSALSLNGAGAVTLGANNLTLTDAGDTFSGVISGTGGSLTLSAGTETLIGANTYTGGTTIAAGTLQIGDGGTTGSIAGNVTDNATLAFDRSDVLTFSGVISGNGIVQILGSGTVVLGGTNAYMGGTTVNAGTLSISQDANLGNGGTLALLNGTTLDITGSGSFTHDVTVAGDPTFNIASGTSVTWTAPITDGSSAGDVTLTGGGTLILTGTDTYTGPTLIEAGVLQVDGSIANSAVTVSSSGKLTGSGNTGAVAVASGATVAPMGTLNVSSASFASGSVYQVAANAAGASSLINATGHVILSGGTVEVTPAAGAYQPITNYVIVNAAGGVSGAFAGVTSSAVALTPYLIYGPDTVDLRLITNNVQFATYGTTPNQIAAGGAVSAGGVGSALYQTLAGATAAAIPGALDSLSGEIHASLRSAALEDSRMIRDAVLGHLAEDPDGVTVWGAGFDDSGAIEGNGNAATLHHNNGGFIGGADMPVIEGLRAGLAGAYSAQIVNVAQRSSRATGDMGDLIGYANWTGGPYDLDLGADYGWGTNKVTRQASVVPETDSDNEDSQRAQIFGQVGYRITSNDVTAEPYAGLGWVSATTGKFAETGGVAALSGKSNSDFEGYSVLGIRIAATGIAIGDMTLGPKVDLGWQHAFTTFLPSQTVTYVTTAQSFTVQGVPANIDSAVARFGFDLAITPSAILSLGYSGNFSNSVQENAIQGGFIWKF